MLGFRPLAAQRTLVTTALLASLVPHAACSPSSGARPREAATPRELTLFLLGDLRGTIEPCGCTTDPLGDMARTARVIADARAAGRAVAVLDAGSLLYSATELTPAIATQERLKSDL